MKAIVPFLLRLYLCCCFSIQLCAQATPPIQIFSPKVTSTGNQNWKIDQLDDGTLVFANNQGVATYNGARWKLYPAKDNSIVRSVKTIGKRIYSSSYMDFGYWEKDSTGELHYTSLAEQFNIEVLEDEQFWTILPYNDRVLFQSLNRILIVSPQQGVKAILRFENTVVKSLEVDGTIYFQVLNEGLYKIEKDKAVLVTNSPLFQENNLVALFEKDDDLLVVTQEKGLYRLSKQMELIPWEANNNLPKKEVNIYAAILLKNGDYALGTVGNGLMIFSANGELKHTYNQTKGLSNNTVLSLFEDKKNNLWLGLDNGINLINKESAIQEYIDVNGQLGTVYTSAVQTNFLYLGTNQGLFVKDQTKNTRFTLIENTQGQVWNLTKIGDQLFCGHDRGAFLIQGKTAQLISTTKGVWRFKPHPTEQNLVFIGHYTGINIIEKVKGKWRDRNKIKGFDISSRFFEFASNNTLVVNHEYKGVFSFELDENFENIKNTRVDAVSCKSCNSSLVNFNGQLFYKAKEALYQFNLSAGKFQTSDLFTKVNKTNDFLEGKLIDGGNGQLWVLAKNNVYTLNKDKAGTLALKSFSLSEGDRKNVSGFENVNPIGDHSYLIGNSRGYLNVNLDQIKKEETLVKITGIKVNNKVESTALSLEDNITLDHDFNNLIYQFTSFDFNRYGKTKYQYILEGEDSQWSDWSDKTRVQYFNLSPGTYQFKLRSKKENVVSPVLEAPAISIAAPWFLNRIAISFYATLVLILLFIYNAYYKNKLKQQRIALNAENKRQLEIQELETQKEIIRLRNEQLKKDIEGKSRELAVATMSTLKRNEFLNSIKSELEEVKDKKANKVIKSINAKLKNNDDWDYFKKAFDNTDQDLFRKLKTAHPSLTKNDLKLCAYLRLNLSSKEIAPLLNISVHSVEIKRYRLRKKMGLERSQGIVEYIMTF